VKSLCGVFNMHGVMSKIPLFSLLPVVIYLALWRSTPDLLIAGILLSYLAVIFNHDYRKDSRSGRLCGTLGGLSYLAKVFGLPFFLTHFVIFNGLHYRRSRTQAEKQIVLRNFVTGIAVLVVIAGAWAVVTSRKYHELTIVPAATVNFSLFESGFLHERA